MLLLDGPHQERREKEGAFSHQRGCDQRVHHQHPQAHPWNVSTARTLTALEVLDSGTVLQIAALKTAL